MPAMLFLMGSQAGYGGTNGFQDSVAVLFSGSPGSCVALITGGSYPGDFCQSADNKVQLTDDAVSDATSLIADRALA